MLETNLKKDGRIKPKSCAGYVLPNGFGRLFIHSCSSLFLLTNATSMHFLGTGFDPLFWSLQNLKNEHQMFALFVVYPIWLEFSGDRLVAAG